MVKQKCTLNACSMFKQFARKDIMSFPLLLEIVKAILASLK